MLEKVALCKCGCGGIAPIATTTDKKRGAIKGQPQNFIHGHNRRKSEDEMYDVDEVSGCWIWKLGTNGVYGMIDQLPAHIVMYRKYKGVVPDGLYIDHLCRNKRCVNPDHLEPVTPAINVQRGRLAKLTADEVVEIRARYELGEDKLTLAAQYMVTKSNIYMIVSRKSWKNIA